MEVKNVEKVNKIVNKGATMCAAYINSLVAVRNLCDGNFSDPEDVMNALRFFESIKGMAASAIENIEEISEITMEDVRDEDNRRDMKSKMASFVNERKK